MIDGDELQQHIDNRKSFRIGAHGICVLCYHNDRSNLWCCEVPRASCEIHADELIVTETADMFSLEMWMNGYQIADVDLSEYEKLTLIAWKG